MYGLLSFATCAAHRMHMSYRPPPIGSDGCYPSRTLERRGTAAISTLMSELRIYSSDDVAFSDPPHCLM